MKNNPKNLTLAKALTVLALSGPALIFTSAKAVTIYPGDSGFETPTVTTTDGFEQQSSSATPGTDQSNLDDSTPYTFDYYFNPVYPDGNGLSGSTGITVNGEGFGSSNTDNTNASDSVSNTAGMGQAAFLQGDQAVAQVISGIPNGIATITFSIESRSSDASPNPVSVYIVPTSEVTTPADFTFLGTFTPESSSTFNTVTSDPIDLEQAGATTGNYVIDFQGTDQGGLTSFLDDISIDAGEAVPITTPEPSALYLSAAGLALLVVLRARRGSSTI